MKRKRQSGLWESEGNGPAPIPVTDTQSLAKLFPSCANDSSTGLKMQGGVNGILEIIPGCCYLERVALPSKDGCGIEVDPVQGFQQLLPISLS